MTMKTAYLKEHEGIAHNTIGQLSSVQTMPWWGVVGPHSNSGESYCQYVSMEHPSVRNQLAATKHETLNSARGIEKGNVTQFAISLGDCSISEDGQKTQQFQAANPINPALPEYQAHFDLGYGQSTICAKYLHMDRSYGVFSACGPQFTGRIMLPLNLTANEGPIYVNAKQYHGIIRRRKLREKADLQNKAARIRKPYMHKSRHLHAMRRPRGCGGRFLNTKSSNTAKGGNDMINAGDRQLSQSTGSQNSEVLQSDSGALHSPKEANGRISNFSGSEVTSMYSRGNLHFYPSNHLMPSVHSPSNIMDSGHGIVKPTTWVLNM